MRKISRSRRIAEDNVGLSPRRAASLSDQELEDEALEIASFASNVLGHYHPSSKALIRASREETRAQRRASQIEEFIRSHNEAAESRGARRASNDRQEARRAALARARARREASEGAPSRREVSAAEEARQRRQANAERLVRRRQAARRQESTGRTADSMSLREMEKKLAEIEEVTSQLLKSFEG